MSCSLKESFIFDLRITDKKSRQRFPLCEMCPNREFFLVRIFRHLNWLWRDTKYFSVFSPNAGIYGPEKTPYLDTFHAVFEIEKRNHLISPNSTQPRLNTAKLQFLLFPFRTQKPIVIKYDLLEQNK